MRPMRSVAIVCLSLILAQGCATYRVTQELERSVYRGSCKVAPIADALPAEMDEEDRPKNSEIGQLLTTLESELRKTGIFSSVEPFNDSSLYVVKATILTFKRGSGAVRALIGFGLGDAKITVDIKLIERHTESVLFAGNFSQTISDWTEEGHKMYGKIARDFANALKTRVEDFGNPEE